MAIQQCFQVNENENVPKNKNKQELNYKVYDNEKM